MGLINTDTSAYALLSQDVYGRKAVSAGSSPTQVRVTFKAGSSNVEVINAAIGIQSSTYVTTGTPIELLFSSGHGFTKNAGESITSDWATLSAGSVIGTVYSDAGGFNDAGWNSYSIRILVPITGATLVVVIDTGAASAGSFASSSSGTSYYLTASATYNSASPAGSWTTWPHITGIATVETQ